jgi:hypothetical protein
MIRYIISDMGLSSSHINIENISKEPVYSIFCSQCKIALSQRGCSVNLISDPDVGAYTTDVAPESIEESKEYHKYKNCNCLNTKVLCKKCKNNCGNHVIYCCEYCLDQPNNGHTWIFLNTVGSKTET